MNKFLKIILLFVITMTLGIVGANAANTKNYKRAKSTQQHRSQKQKNKARKTAKYGQVKAKYNSKNYNTKINEEEIRKKIRQEIEDSIRTEVTKEMQGKKEIITKEEDTTSNTPQNDTTKRIENFGQNSILHENILSIGGGWNKINDMYLSPLTYKGFNIFISNEWWQELRKTADFGHVGKIELKYGNQKNGAHATYNYNSNTISDIEIEGGWGIFSSLHRNNFEVKIGPYLSLYSDVKYIYNSYNKPCSADLATDLNLMFSIGTYFSGNKTSYRLRYLGYLNVIGAEFYPDYWQSYYELRNTWNKSVHFSYIGKRIALRQEVTFDMQLLNSTWRIGLKHDYLNYGTEDMRFRHEYISIIIGTIFNYKIDGKVNFSK